MFDKAKLTRLVDLQQRTYQLLKWVADAVPKGFISFENAHDYSTLPESALAWIKGHYLNIPENARPEEKDLEPFANFFSTYLVNSFDLVANPGKRPYSPGAHCFCPMCSWMIDAPTLKTKRPRSGQKNRAEKLRQNAIAELSAQKGHLPESSWLEKVSADQLYREDVSLVAYGLDLFGREQGIAEGPAILVLWRSFAWTSEGSPKKNFQLSADLIINAESRLLELVKSQDV